MRVTRKCSLEIKMKEFYLYAKPLVSKKEIHKAIKSELYQCLMGIIDGDWGGSSQDWKNIFYEQLYKGGFIEQTELSIEVYGRF